MNRVPYSRVVKSVACIVDSYPPGGQGFGWRVRDYVCCVSCPLPDLIHEIHRKVVVERETMMHVSITKYVAFGVI